MANGNMDEECDRDQETLAGLKLYVSDLESQLLRSQDEFARLAGGIPELTHRDVEFADDGGVGPPPSSFIFGGPRPRSGEADEGGRDPPAGERGRDPPATPHDRDWGPAAPLDDEMEPVLPPSSSPPRNAFVIGELDDAMKRALVGPARPKGYTSRARQRKILAAACALVLLSAGGLAALGGGDGKSGLRGAAVVTKSDFAAEGGASVGGAIASDTAEQEASLGGANASESDSNVAGKKERINIFDMRRIPPEQPAPSNARPLAIDEVCEDDPTYFRDDGHLGRGHNCANFVEHVGRPKLLHDRCNKPSMTMDDDGAELPVKHFCRHSCGMCDD